MTRRRLSRAALSSSSSSVTALGGVGFDGAGVAFGDELTVDGFEVGDACDQVGSVGGFDFGAELQAEALLQLVALGAQRLDLVAGDGQVGAQTGRCRAVLTEGVASVPGLSLAWRRRAASTCSRIPSA